MTGNEGKWYLLSLYSLTSVVGNLSIIVALLFGQGPINKIGILRWSQKCNRALLHMCQV